MFSAATIPPVSQDRDKTEETMEYLVKSFGNIVDYEVIHNVALNCNFHFDTISNILLEMTGTYRNTPSSSTGRNFQGIPQQHQQLQYQPERPQQVLPQHIANDINNGYRVMILMRGLPGSGKSTKAREIVRTFMKTTNYHEFIFSADDYFINKRTGAYVYNVSKIRDAHESVQNKVFVKARAGSSPIIVDNTHTQMWEMKCFVAFATNFGYKIEIVEPSTSWAFSEKELFRRNVHDVPKAKIKEMLERYERHITPGELLLAYHMSYKELKPPVLRNYPPIMKQSESKSLKTDGLPNVVVDAQTPKNNLFCQPSGGRSAEVSTPPDVSLGATATVQSLHQPLRSTSAYTLDVTPFTFEHKTATLESLQRKSNSIALDVIPLKEQVQPLNLNPFLHSTEQSSSASSCNLNISTHQMKSLESFSNDNSNSWKSWDMTSFPTSSSNNMLSLSSFNLLENKSTAEASTNTTNSDFSLLSNGAGDALVVNAKSRDINMGVIVNNSPKNTAKKVLLDKSSMTSEDKVVTDNEDIQELMVLFDGIPVNYLRDVYEKCGHNLNWTVDLLLDDNKDILPEAAQEDEPINLENTTDTESMPEVVQLTLPQGLSIESNSVVVDREIETLQILFSNLSVDYLVDVYKRVGRNLTTAIDFVLNNDRNEESKSTDTVIENNLSEQKTELPQSREIEELKRQIEENIVINKEHYSDHVLKLKDSRQLGATAASSVNNLSPTRITNGEDFVFVERNLSSNQFEEEERMELNLGQNLIAQLEAKFGCLNMIPQGFQPVINIPIDLAKQLHAQYVESVFVQMENQNQVLEMLVKEDEEFVKNLLLQEELPQSHTIKSENLLQIENDEEASNLNQIMRDQLSSSLQQREIEEWINLNSPDDWASKLALNKLTTMFPSIPKLVIMEILMAHKFSYEETVEVLKASTDCEFSLPQEVISNMKIVKEEFDKECEEDDYNKTAEEYREEAQMHLAKHREKMECARNALQRKQYTVAQFYSELAKSHTKLYEKANSKAAAAFIEQNANRLNESNLLDLHSLYVKEALHALDVFIDVNVNLLKESNRTSQELWIITGRGKNSTNGRSKLKPAVQTRLRRRNIPFNIYHYNPGKIKIKISIYTTLTCDM